MYITPLMDFHLLIYIKLMVIQLNYTILLMTLPIFYMAIKETILRFLSQLNVSFEAFVAQVV